MPNTKCADVLKLNSAYICQICKSFQICAYSQICRSLNLFVKSVLKPWIYPSNIPAVEERVIKFQTWCTREFWETLHPSPDFVKSWWKFSISRLIHQQHMTASIIYCPLCHSGGSGDLFVYLGFDSSIFVFLGEIVCFYIWLWGSILKGVLWGKVKCFVTNFISDSECSHGGWGSREGERWLGGWQSW